MKRIGKLDLSNASVLVNGGLNPLMSNEMLAEKENCTIEEIIENKDRSLAWQRKRTAPTLAQFMATHGGTGSVKCESFEDLEKTVRITWSWNEFNPENIISIFKKHFDFQIYYGNNNPNSGQRCEFEFWFEGDAIEVHISHFNKKDTHNVIKKENGDWIEYEYDNLYLEKMEKLGKELNADNVVSSITEHDFNGYSQTLRFWWD